MEQTFGNCNYPRGCPPTVKRSFYSISMCEEGDTHTQCTICNMCPHVWKKERGKPCSLFPPSSFWFFFSAVSAIQKNKRMFVLPNHCTILHVSMHKKGRHFNWSPRHKFHWMPDGRSKCKWLLGYNYAKKTAKFRSKFEDFIFASKVLSNGSVTNPHTRF